MADGLADGAADEDDVRNGEDGPPAEEVAEHARDEAAEERADGGGRRDQFLA